MHIKTRLEFPLCPSAACDLDFLEYSFQLFSKLSRDRADLWFRGLFLQAMCGNDGMGEANGTKPFCLLQNGKFSPTGSGAGGVGVVLLHYCSYCN